MKIGVLIVDDHAVVRSGLRYVLEAEEDIDVVGEAADARHAVFETRATKPDVVLMDVVMPGKSGIEAIPDVLKDAPDATSRTAATRSVSAASLRMYPAAPAANASRT